MEYTVVVEKKHCEGRKYRSVTDCPLCAAIREQLPEFLFRSIGGDHITDVVGKEWYFNAHPSNGWCSSVIDDIVGNKMETFSITFHDWQMTRPVEEAPKPKEVIRYVSVPESIKEQKEELILN